MVKNQGENKIKEKIRTKMLEAKPLRWLEARHTFGAEHTSSQHKQPRVSQVKRHIHGCPLKMKKNLSFM